MSESMIPGVTLEEFETVAQLNSDLGELERLNKLYYKYRQVWREGEVPDGRPYPWQVKFHNAGSENVERAVVSANQIGKSECAAAELACHLTGLYPDWWQGKRFSLPVSVIAIEPTNLMIREIAQPKLLGEMMDGVRRPDGTGWVPSDAIGQFTFRYCGMTNVIDTCEIKHVSGGLSRLRFMSYEQEADKFQGFQCDVGWLDEEPRDMRIFAEMQRATAVREGILLFTRTPLYGMTDMIEHFLNAQEGHGIWHITVSWDDAPHMTDERKAHLLRALPKHELEARTRGIPIMGSGVVFAIADVDISVPAFSISDHFAQVLAMDFGINHPWAGVKMAWDRDADIVYLVDCRRMSDETPPHHCSVLRSMGGDWIPVAWPKDGESRDKGSGVRLSEMYRREGLMLMGDFAQWPESQAVGKFSFEAGVAEMQDRLQTGRLKIFDHLNLWFEEKRIYHRDESGKIVLKKDDLLDATRYGLMMLRYAISKSQSQLLKQSSTVTDDSFDPVASF